MRRPSEEGQKITDAGRVDVSKMNYFKKDCQMTLKAMQTRVEHLKKVDAKIQQEIAQNREKLRQIEVARERNRLKVVQHQWRKECQFLEQDKKRQRAAARTYENQQAIEEARHRVNLLRALEADRLRKEHHGRVGTMQDKRYSTYVQRVARVEKAKEVAKETKRITMLKRDTEVAERMASNAVKCHEVEHQVEAARLRVMKAEKMEEIWMLRLRQSQMYEEQTAQELSEVQKARMDRPRYPRHTKPPVPRQGTNLKTSAKPPSARLVPGTSAAGPSPRRHQVVQPSPRQPREPYTMTDEQILDALTLEQLTEISEEHQARLAAIQEAASRKREQVDGRVADSRVAEGVYGEWEDLQQHIGSPESDGLHFGEGDPHADNRFTQAETVEQRGGGIETLDQSATQTNGQAPSPRRDREAHTRGKRAVGPQPLSVRAREAQPSSRRMDQRRVVSRGGRGASRASAAAYQRGGRLY